MRKKGILAIIFCIVLIIIGRILFVNLNKPKIEKYHIGELVNYGTLSISLKKAYFADQSEKQKFIQKVVKQSNGKADRYFDEGWDNNEKLLVLLVEENQAEIPGNIYKKGTFTPILSQMNLLPEDMGDHHYKIYYPISREFNKYEGNDYVLNLAGSEQEKKAGYKGYIEFTVEGNK